MHIDRLNPLWKFLFGGCNLNRATDKWILEGFEWAETKGKSWALSPIILTRERSKFQSANMLAVRAIVEMDIDFENEKALDPKAYGWARKPSRN